MPIIIFQRNKCIGCNYCTEIAPEFWCMSKKDGKTVLIGSVRKKEFWTLSIPEVSKTINEQAASSCPVKVIQVR